MRALIVDDMPDLRLLIELLLELDGFDVVTATEGSGALQAVHRQSPDLVVLDIHLSGGDDGFEVCRQIRRVSKARIVMVTGCGDRVDKTRAFEAGADDYITKPFSPRDFMERVNAIVSRPPATT